MTCSASTVSNDCEPFASETSATGPTPHAGADTHSGTQFWRPLAPPRLPSSEDTAVPCTITCDDESLPGPDAPVLPPGTRLPGSRLRILDRLSDGACGVVYRGEHIDLQRPLAIKVQRRELFSSDARQLFLDEARTTIRISSPYVVQVIDFGELTDGRVWYAMELLGGCDLDRVLEDGGAMAPARAIALLRMACKALAAAHDAGVVHRDVKPPNFVVIERGGREQLVLVDFGIAFPTGEMPATVCGTPEYMAPEQIARSVLDPRTDVYGLGCCAYEMLTGTAVVQGTTVAQVLCAHGTGVDPVFPPGIPAALQEVVRRCLALDPDDRHADMRELEAALCEAQVSDAIVPVRHDIEPPTVDEARRRRIVEGLTALDRPPRPRRSLPSLRVPPKWIGSVAAACTVLAVLANGPSAASPAPVGVAIAGLADMDGPIAAPEPIEPPVRTAPAPAVIEPLVVATPPETPPQTVAPPVAPPTMTVEARVHEALRAARRAMRRGDRRTAEREFRRAAELDPHASAPAAGLADVYFERGDHERAIDYARIAVRHAPRNAEHRIRLGDSHFRLGHREAARKAYLAAAALGSKMASARLAALAKTGT